MAATDWRPVAPVEDSDVNQSLICAWKSVMRLFYNVCVHT